MTGLAEVKAGPIENLSVQAGEYMWVFIYPHSLLNMPRGTSPQLTTDGRYDLRLTSWG